MMTPLRFTLEDSDRAHAEWGANCGQPNDIVNAFFSCFYPRK